MNEATLTLKEAATANKYANDKNVKWIVAQRKIGSGWEIRYLSGLSSSSCPSLRYILDETPIGVIKISEFGVFRNRADWWTYRPSRYYRGYDVPIYFNTAVGALINALPSDWF